MSTLFNRIQVYAENTGTKFPIDDTVETEIPSDALVDMSIVVPESLAKVSITNLVIRGRLVFLTVEADILGVWHTVGHLALNFAEPWRVYELDCQDGCSGWVVFGPGVQRELEVIRTPARIDYRVVRRAVVAEAVQTLEVNGVSYAMPSVLTVRVNSYLQTSIETRYLEDSSSSSSSSSSEGEISASALVFRRDDSVVTDGMRRFGLTDNVVSPEGFLYTINNISPDDDGRFTITLRSEGGSLAAVPVTADGSPLGALFLTACVDGCPDADEELDSNIRTGKRGQGVPYNLPLDAYASS